LVEFFVSLIKLSFFSVFFCGLTPNVECVERFQHGWHTESIILAGKSLGAATSIHYTLQHNCHISNVASDNDNDTEISTMHIRRLILMCPAGAAEHDHFMMPHVGRALARFFLLLWIRPDVLRKLIMRLLKVMLWWSVWVRKIYNHIYLLTNTPDYNVPAGFARRLAATTEIVSFSLN
jgi:pimeloyl-ACP methyl ester carboxylesterase